MASVHQSTWKKAGVYEAIFSSTYQIKRQTDSFFRFAERWCSETNTFIFPWGEATITLEDIMVLGGFSVFGDSVLSPLVTTELKEIKDKLLHREEIIRSRAKKATTSLSVFSITIHLSSGTRIALAPAVLSSVYNDLGVLKKATVDSNQWEVSSAAEWETLEGFE
ncbi:hypothetical protein ACFX13_031295 [Malus domestica]